MEALIELDRIIFEWVNSGIANKLFDFILPPIRNKLFWLPLYLFIICYFPFKYKRDGIWLVIGLLCTLAFCDQFSAGLMKPLFNRPRPCHVPEIFNEFILRVRCGPGKSFISAHATNHFGIAIFLIQTLRHKYKWILPIALIWAASISFAQVYVGVHYPSDITVGACSGIIIGIFTSSLYKRYFCIEG